MNYILSFCLLNDLKILTYIYLIMSFKYIAGYDDKYKIYENGKIFVNEQEIESFIHKTLNIPFVSLCQNGHWKTYSVARLVYETFVGKIKDGTKLKYKDHDTNNVCLENLENVRKWNKINNGVAIELDNTKQWKPMRGYEELYKISEYGDVYSIRINKIMTQYLSEKGYYSICLKKDKIQKILSIHRLVHMTFNNCDIKDDHVIDHIDRNKINNHKSNLREVTKTVNSQNVDKKIRPPYSKISQYDRNGNFIKKWNSFDDIVKSNPTYKISVKLCCLGQRSHAYGFIWRYDDFVLDQIGYEQVRTDDGKIYSNYKINKQGIIISKNGHIMKPSAHEYVSVNLVSDCGKKSKFRVHRLVMITFVPNPENKSDVNHLDENKHNNNIDNLQWATRTENVRHSNSKQVQQINIDTNEVIKTHDCALDALISLKINESDGGISKVCNGKQKTAHGFTWKFVD
jgi:hypothetical protein